MIYPNLTTSVPRAVSYRSYSHLEASIKLLKMVNKCSLVYGLHAQSWVFHFLLLNDKLQPPAETESCFLSNGRDGDTSVVTTSCLMSASCVSAIRDDVFTHGNYLRCNFVYM